MESVTFVIFGATGDLAKRNLIPALYRLFVQKKLPKFALVGAAIDTVSAYTMLEHATAFIKERDSILWQEFSSHAYYIPLHFESLPDYYQLLATIEAAEKNFGLSGNRIIYCSTASRYFEVITRHTVATGIITRQTKNSDRWYRIAYEKPFGHNAESARSIHNVIKKMLSTDQVFYIDHFIAKDLVDNIMFIRCANRIFESVWNSDNIEHITITLNESIGIEGRGAFYDATGALLDVVQNHMLQMMALVTMDLPDTLTNKTVQQAKAHVLKKFTFIDGILGQYQGYRDESHVNPHSATETFAALLFKVNTKRWKDVCFFLETGKCLDKKSVTITIIFKSLACARSLPDPYTPDQLIIHISPEMSFELKLNAKEPGNMAALRQISMKFCYNCLWPEAPEAYEVIFEALIHNDHSISIDFPQIESAWQIIDAIKARQLPLYSYSQQSTGPKEVALLRRRYHHCTI